MHNSPSAAGVTEEMQKISVVVPVYCNEGSLHALFERLCAVEDRVRRQGLEMELIFVDDGSSDGSLARLLEIKKLRPATTVVKLTRNFGEAPAIKTGLQRAGGACCVVLAADLQDPPELIPDMVEKWRQGAKFVVCERISRDDPPMSKLLSRMYYRLLQTFVIEGYPRGGYDLALMDKDMLPYLRRHSKSLFTPVVAYWLGFRPAVIPYHRQKRLHGESKWSLAKRVKMFLDVMLGFSARPLRLISGIGLLVSALSFCYGIVVIVEALLGNIPVPGFATLACLITFLLGLVIVMLGIIGEYLWRVFEEVNRRPEAVIDEVF